MATMDWQTPLSASLGLLSTAAVHLFRALAWVLLNVVAVVPRYLYRAGAVVATPLTYPLYFLWRTLAFVLSPVWALGSACVGVVSWALELAVRFKVSDEAFFSLSPFEAPYVTFLATRLTCVL
jgi:hypothetical protein